MNMQAFSKQVGLSAYTLRYYEKIGLLKNIRRNASGHRSYSNKDREWVGFIVRLKETGMPLENILQYAELREIGKGTLVERQQLLEQHQAYLTRHIALQLSHLEALESKINWYKSNKMN
ncbi:MerR family transcriptional regulator [Marinomonas transparens]|uniref:MerR family transcriptional regulator n=1 Tax=Marinomonas transparens TaxID=2795388 RepID=A0A934JYQ5_9GAMM|nr:MerR family transcriptional regulator [Marinomonas transparens]MBJ7539675.1 MerR family transcriptional regulator [Marinomonas transparens]